MRAEIQITKDSNLVIQADYLGVFSQERDHFQYLITIEFGEVSYQYHYNAPPDHFKRGNFELSESELIETALYGLEAAISGSGTFEGYIEVMGYDIDNIPEFERARSEYKACSGVYARFEKAGYDTMDIQFIIKYLLLKVNNYYLSNN